MQPRTTEVHLDAVRDTEHTRANIATGCGMKGQCEESSRLQGGGGRGAEEGGREGGRKGEGEREEGREGGEAGGGEVGGWEGQAETISGRMMWVKMFLFRRVLPKR